MRVKCPQCIHNVDVEPGEGGPFCCPDCGALFRRGGLFPVAPRRERANARPVPIARRSHLQEVEELEERQERSERREFRRECRQDRREDRRDDRERNLLAIAGFCVGLASLVLVLGGLLFGKQLPLYLAAVLPLAVIGALAGLVCSLLGLFLRKAMRPLAVAGAAVGAVLLLLLIPAGLLLLKG
jgi:hypothetical protein